MAGDEIFMERALALAEMGKGNTSPNPLVGAVLVHNNRVIGEGYHAKYGHPHAEVNAIASVSSSDSDKIPGSTLYVNLEPCSHQGQTPPCTELVLAYKIPRVVIANRDPLLESGNEGVRILEDHGVDVTTGVLQKQGEALNRSFFTYDQNKRPYIILKWAQTANALFAPHDTQQVWISGQFAKRLVHRWRAQEDAIMVGTETAAIDNPSLTCRLWAGQHPIRVVIDNHLRLDSSRQLFDQNATTLVYTTSNDQPKQTPKTVTYRALNKQENFIEQVVGDLHKHGIQSIIVEGGANLLSSFIKATLWDEARVFTSNKYFTEGKSAPQLPVTPTEQHVIEEDELLVFHNSKTR